MVIGNGGSTIYSLASVFLDPKLANQYLLEKMVFYETLACPQCGETMQPNVELWRFRCRARTCRLDRSLYSHTFFFGTMLKSNEILFLGRLWLAKVPLTSAIELSGHSPNTVVKFWNHFRELVSSTLAEEDVVIGGENVIVEVDETKLGKRKYNRGHHVEGVWVVVGVERTEARKVFVIPVHTRDSDTLRSIITNHVRPGSIIHTDLWRGYSWLDNAAEYTHQTVNHSQGFINYETGVHTNFVEGTNAGIKRRIPVRSRVREGIELHLGEFVWRRKNEGRDIWIAFVEALREIHYVVE